MPEGMAWTLVGVAAALLTTFGFAPQVVKMWRTRSVNDVSPLTFLQFIAGSSLWALYGLHRRDPVLTVANVTALAILLTALALWVAFRPRRPSH